MCFNFLIRDYHPLWLYFPENFYLLKQQLFQSYNPYFTEIKQVWAYSLSLATTQEIAIAFSSSGYLDVSVLQVCVKLTISLQLIRLPHSEIQDSTFICNSSWLIAAYHVLHRLQEPRYSPYALIHFQFLIILHKYVKELNLNNSILKFVEDIGFEPMTPCLQSRCSSQLS